MTNVSDSEYEGNYNHENDNDIESQEYPDLGPTNFQNQRPKWAQNLIEAAGNVAVDLDDKRRTRSQYQNEHVTLYNLVSLPLMR